MDPTAILSLIGDLYASLGQARRDLADVTVTIERLQAELAEARGAGETT